MEAASTEDRRGYGIAVTDTSSDDRGKRRSTDEDGGNPLDIPRRVDGKIWKHKLEFDTSPPDASFPRFCRLPPELRRRVWELFCPEIVTAARIFPLTMASPEKRREGRAQDSFRPVLCSVTLRMRRLLAVNQESRAIALQAAPDSLPIGVFRGEMRTTGTVRFNRDRDIIILNGESLSRLRRRCLDFTDSVKNLGVEAYPVGLRYETWRDRDIRTYRDALGRFPNLKRLYSCQPLYSNGERWLKKPAVSRHFIGPLPMHEGEMLRDWPFLYCWPRVPGKAALDALRAPSSLHEDICNLKQRVDVRGLEVVLMIVCRGWNQLGYYKGRIPNTVPDCEPFDPLPRPRT